MEVAGGYDSDTTVEADSDREEEGMVIGGEEELAVQSADVQFAATVSQPASSSSSQNLESKHESTEESGSLKEATNSKLDTNEDDDDGDDGRTCPICMDIWSNTGSHRLASLRCGHLFGHSCILRWLQVACSAGQRRCPQCNKKASVKDIRLHYARKLQVLDTAERDRIRDELQSVQREKNRLELELARANLNQQLHLQQIAELRQKLAQMQKQACNGHCKYNMDGSLAQKSSQKQELTHLSILQSVEICKDGGCRVMAYNAWLKLIVVSQRSTNNLFSGFGIKKIDAPEFRQTQFVFLHPKPIRDMAFHPQRNDMLLTVSLDRCVKLFNVSNNAVVQNYTTDNPLWSCCWDADNSNMFFVGTCNGAILQYDIRSTSEPLTKLTSLDDLSPVSSLVAIPPCPGRTLSRGGILACRLNSCWAYELRDSQYMGSQIPFDGPFVSMCYDRNTEHILISTRPSARSAHARHILCQLPQTTAGEEHSLVCNPIHTFQGSTSQNLLSRPCLIPIKGDTLIAAHQESLKSIALWSVSSGCQIINSPASQPVIDLCPVQVNSNQYLAALSEKWLRIYNIR